MAGNWHTDFRKPATNVFDRTAAQITSLRGLLNHGKGICRGEHDVDIAKVMWERLEFALAGGGSPWKELTFDHIWYRPSH